ncbi:hypothetical protein K8I61_05065 [bacterium]|nr:hypothetical protein [bacterium]
MMTKTKKSKTRKTATIRRMEAEAAFAAAGGLKYTAAQIRREIRQLMAKREVVHENR